MVSAHAPEKWGSTTPRSAGSRRVRLTSAIVTSFAAWSPAASRHGLHTLRSVVGVPRKTSTAGRRCACTLIAGAPAPLAPLKPYSACRIPAPLEGAPPLDSPARAVPSALPPLPATPALGTGLPIGSRHRHHPRGAARAGDEPLVARAAAPASRAAARLGAALPPVTKRPRCAHLTHPPLEPRWASGVCLGRSATLRGQERRLVQPIRRKEARTAC